MTQWVVSIQPEGEAVFQAATFTSQEAALMAAENFARGLDPSFIVVVAAEIEVIRGSYSGKEVIE